MKDYKPYLLHILDEANYIVKHSSIIDYESFVNNETFRRSFIRSIEIIGEAVKKLPENIKDTYSSIPWKKIAGMRDILIHEYFGVNYKLVWDVAKNKIPELKSEIEKIIMELNNHQD